MNNRAYIAGQLAFVVIVGISMLIVVLGRIFNDDWTAAGVWLIAWLLWSRT